MRSGHEERAPRTDCRAGSATRCAPLVPVSSVLVLLFLPHCVLGEGWDNPLLTPANNVAKWRPFKNRWTPRFEFQSADDDNQPRGLRISPVEDEDEKGYLGRLGLLIRVQSESNRVYIYEKHSFLAPDTEPGENARWLLALNGDYYIRFAFGDSKQADACVEVLDTYVRNSDKETDKGEFTSPEQGGWCNAKEGSQDGFKFDLEHDWHPNDDKPHAVVAPNNKCHCIGAGGSKFSEQAMTAFLQFDVMCVVQRNE